MPLERISLLLHSSLCAKHLLEVPALNFLSLQARSSPKALSKFSACTDCSIRNCSLSFGHTSLLPVGFHTQAEGASVVFKLKSCVYFNGKV